MKVSAVFENVDAAELAARQIREAGVAVRHRRIRPLSREAGEHRHLPTEAWYFPAAAEFRTGMNVPPHVMTPGMAFYPMAGHVTDGLSRNGEARLELEVAEELGGALCDLLRSLHGTSICRSQDSTPLL